MKKIFLLLSTLILLIWYQGFRFSCLFGIIFIPIFGILLHQIYFFKISIKKCQLACYLQTSSFYYKLMNTSFIITLKSIAEALILTTALLLFLTTLTTLEITILFIDSFILFFLYQLFTTAKWFKESIKSYAIIFFSSHINALFLTLFFTWNSFYQTPPSYIHDSLIQTLQAAYNIHLSDCSAIDTMLSYIQLLQALKWWIILHILATEISSFLKVLLWILFITGNYLALFSFSRYTLYLTYLLERIADGKQQY